MRVIFSVLTICLLVACSEGDSDVTTNDTKAVSETLDAFHLAASEANGKRYFSLFAENSVFIGTDKKRALAACRIQGLCRSYIRARTRLDL